MVRGKDGRWTWSPSAHRIRTVSVGVHQVLRTRHNIRVQPRFRRRRNSHHRRSRHHHPNHHHHPSPPCPHQHLQRQCQHLRCRRHHQEEHRQRKIVRNKKNWHIQYCQPGTRFPELLLGSNSGLYCHRGMKWWCRLRLSAGDTIPSYLNTHCSSP